MSESNITFNDLPSAMACLIQKVDQLTTLVQEKYGPKKEEDRWFNVDELLTYLPDRPAKSTVYGWVGDNLIPYHKNGKKLRFLKSEIDAWLLKNRNKTEEELQEEAARFTYFNKGGAR